MASMNSNQDRKGLLTGLGSDLSRASRITAVLIRHGFSSIFSRVGVEDPNLPDAPDVLAEGPAEAAKRFRMVLEELGPTFVKVGQILSTRPDLVPPVFITELEKLQSNATPVPFEELRPVLEASLGAPIADRFANFDETPLASASMAQAHVAQLPDGTEVVVKVLRPGIREVIRSDLDIMRFLAWLLEATIREMQLFAPQDLVSSLEDALMDELDFRREAANLERFRNNFLEHPDIAVPRMFSEWSSADVLVMERLHGRRITDIEPSSERAQGYANTLLELAYLTIFEHGFFHGDPHPGNIFAMDDGRLGLIDFGMCGTLSSQQRDHLITLILAVISGDSDSIARVLMRMGQPLARVHISEFKTDIEDIRDRYLLRNLEAINVAAFLEECMDAAQRYKIRITGSYLVLAKSIMTAEGIVRYLDPNLDLVAALQPYAKKLVRLRLDPERALERSLAALLYVTQAAREVPDQLSQVLMDLEGGHLRVNVAQPEAEELRREMSRQTSRIALAAFSSASIIAAVILLPNDPWRVTRYQLPVFTLLLVTNSLFQAWACMVSHFAGRQFKGFKISPLLRIFGK